MKYLVLALLFTAGCSSFQEPICKPSTTYQSHYEASNFGQCVPNSQ
jgi:hypothetical protein